MSRRDDEFSTPASKKIRFRGDLNFYHFDNHIEDIFDEPDRGRKAKCGDNNTDDKCKRGELSVLNENEII